MYIYICDSFKTYDTSERITNINNISNNSKTFFFCEAVSRMFLICDQNYEKS